MKYERRKHRAEGSRQEIVTFRKKVWAYYRKGGRHSLPWRHTRNPYWILVSEVMLQQTQVERVIPYYRQWVKKFPTVKALAKASLSEVLTAWQGLGYNRRAKYLHQASHILVHVRPTRSNMSVEDLERLPGVGAYTARAVAAFAYNQDVVCIETNIRTAVMYHFFPKKNAVSDKEIEKIMAQALPKGRSREWYGALMDYGTYLKSKGIRLNTRTKGYAKQSVFMGSVRQARGTILRELTKGERTHLQLRGLLGKERTEQLMAQIQKLMKEGLIEKTGRRYHVPA